MSFFCGKAVIVTGSSSGIGREAARIFASLGAKVTVTGRRADALEKTKKMCLQAGAKEGDILEERVLGEITSEETAKKIINETVSKFGSLDVLVNNAGAQVSDKEGRHGIDQPIALYDQIFNLNVRSVIVLSQLAVPHLEKTKGAIINISSIVGELSTSPSSPYYSMAKAAVNSLTVQMAGTLIHKGIRVNAVCPGLVQTNFLTSAGFNQEGSDSFYGSVGSDRKAIPLGRPGTVKDITELIVFLADRSRSEYIVGQRIVSDGGSTLINYMLTNEF